MTDVFGYGQPGYGVPNYSGLQNASLLGGYSSRAALDTPHVAGTPWDVVLSNGQAESVPDLGGGLHFYGPVSHDGPVATSDPEVMAHKDRQFSTGLNQAAIKIAGMILGGTALTGGFGGAAGSAGTPFQAAGEYGAVPGAEVAAGSIPTGAYQASGEFGGVLGDAIAPVEGLAGSPAQASGEYGSVAGTPDYIPTGATQASGEYGSGGWLDKLTQLAKQSTGGGSGGGQAQVSAPPMPQRSGGGFLQQIVKPRPNYLGQFGDQVMAAQNANNFLLTSKLFGRDRK